VQCGRYREETMTADIYLAGKKTDLDDVIEIKYFKDFEKDFLTRLLGVLRRTYVWNDDKLEYEVGSDFFRDFVYVDGDSGTIESILEKLRIPLFLIDSGFEKLNRTDRTDRTNRTYEKSEGLDGKR
jgi:hypothetical protein